MLGLLCGLVAFPARQAAADACGYPFGSGRTAVVFNESTVLRAFDPVTSQTTVLGQGLTIKAFYSDEHALTLGATSISVKTASGTSVQCSSALPAGTLPGCVSNPSIGCAGAVDPAQRPLWPALFITDITGNTGNTDGDWQHGGAAHAPNRVCGVWKGCTVLIDQTVSPARVTVTTATDPAKNTWAGIPDTPPGGFGALSSEGYGAEVVWNVDDPSLGLVAGHTYRLQFMVHDGDQNKTGGDVGEGCTIVTIAPPLRVHVIPETSHLCQGQTVELCAQIDPSNPGLPPYTFSWTKQSNPGVVIATSQCITVPAPPAGTSEIYTVLATDSFKQHDSASGTVFGQRCEIAIEKSATPNHVCAGQNADVTYSYVVGNTGDYFPASGTLIDDNGTPGNPGDDFTTSWGPLAPGASQTLTQKRTINTSSPLINTARATGATGAGGTASVSAQDTTIVIAQRCEIGIIKAAQPNHVCAGKAADVTYGYLVGNAGDFFAASGTLVDDNGTPGNPADDYTTSWGPLAPGATQTLFQHRTVNISSPLINTARATGTTGPGGTASVSAQDTTIVIPHRCEIAVLKAAQPNNICAGKDVEVTFGYVVGNIGDFFAASGTLLDDNGTPGNPADDFSTAWGPLAPGATQTLFQKRTMNTATPVINTARAAGTTGPGGTASVSAQDTTIVIPHRCEIAVEKSVAPSHVCAGKAADVTYGFKVTNSGDFFAAAGTLVDDNGTPGNTGDDFTLGSWGPLAPGASQSFSRLRSINITSPLINTATATGTTGPGGSAAVSAQDTTVVIPQRCEIALTKTPDVCEVQEGIATPVNYTYVITNTGDYFSASGTLVDDNGTPGFTGDDVKVCDWGPIVPAASANCAHSFTLTGSRTNVATASGVSGTASVTAQATAKVGSFSCVCNLGYPDNSSLPRSGVLFNESEVLRAFDPGPTTCGSTGSTIKLWYNDEHALTLGASSVSIKTASGTTVSCSSALPAGTVPGCASHPSIGCTAAVDPSGRPLAPELFITDLSVNGAGSRAGDWQQGGTGIAPHRVCGVWKGAAVLIDQTVTPARVTVTTASDPAKNNWAGIPDTPPGGFAALTNQGYGAECSWNVDELGLIAGHTYRLQFMVHDGDQNKAGGDVGEACTTAHIPQTGPCVPVIAVVAGGGQAAAMQAPGGEEAAGQAQGSEPAAQGPAIADGLELYRPTPNPFREAMRFAYAVSGPEAQPVRVGVYDVTGRQIRQLAAGLMVPGRYQSRWDGRNDAGGTVGGGIYFVRVVAGGKQVAFRVLYLK